MKTLSLKILGILLLLGVAFTSCNDDFDFSFLDSNALENVDIIIDDDQTFNMTMFAMTFEQLFGSNARWKWDYTLDVESGKALVTYQNRKNFGKFGDKAFTIVHDYNSDGVITSSTRNHSYGYYSEDVFFTYRYDNKGRIVELTKRTYGYTRDVVELEYNSNNQLVKKTHKGDYHFSDGDIEEFTYNSDGTVKSYFNSRWDESHDYTYAGGNMIRDDRDYNGDLSTRHYEYDSEGRLINRYDDDEINDNRAFEYYDTYYREIDYDDYNGTRRIDDIEDYTSYEVTLKRWDFHYDDATFEYCKTRQYYYVENGNRRLVDKKEYWSGTPENLVLDGYVTVDSRNPADDYKKTKESIYDANDTLLYYITYDLSYGYIQDHQVYLPDGTPIDDSEMADLKWIEVLISEINMT